MRRIQRKLLFRRMKDAYSRKTQVKGWITKSRSQRWKLLVSSITVLIYSRCTAHKSLARLSSDILPHGAGKPQCTVQAHIRQFHIAKSLRLWNCPTWFGAVKPTSACVKLLGSVSWRCLFPGLVLRVCRGFAGRDNRVGQMITEIDRVKERKRN